MSWYSTTLGEHFSKNQGVIQTGPFGSQLHQSDYKEVGTPVIMPKDIVNNRIDVGTIAKVNNEDRDRLKKHIVKVNDIVYPRRGEITKRAFITEQEEGYICGTGCILIRNVSLNLDSQFLNYFLSDKKTTDWLESNAVGSTMKNLSGAILKKLPLVIPPMETQQKIASILSKYDNLIENNLKRIGLLEEAAQHLYKEWFVNFRFPGSENTSINEKTGLPEGWKRKSITEFEAFKQYKVKAKDFKGRKKYLATADVVGLKVNRDVEKFEFNNKPSRAQIIPTNNSVWFARMSATKKLLFFSNNSNSDYLISSGFVGFKAKTKYHLPFLFCLVNNDKFEMIKDSYATGSTQVSLNNKSLQKIELVEPTQGLIEEFGKIVYPFLEEIETLFIYNETLKEARDLLLPRLMNRTIEV